MKKITLLLIAMISYVGFAQSTIDFETGGVGAAWTWTVDQNDTNPALEFVANPNTTGNTSAMTAKLTTKAGGKAWALAYSDGIGSFTFDANNSLVKMMVRKTVATDVAIKFEIPNGINKEVKATTTVTNGDWEELSFDFSSVIGSTYSRIVIIPDFLARTTDNIVYFDQITFNSGTQPAVPSTAAPTPTQNAADVISLFSDAYTDVASSTSPGWNEVVTAETHATNPVLKTTNFLPFAITSAIDVTDHTLHVDVWLPALPSAGAGLLIKILDSANNGPHEGNYTYPIANLTAGQWNSIDIDISDFTQVQGTWDATAQGRVDQVLVDIVDDTTMYVDNVYFWKAPTAGIDDPLLSSVKLYPNPTNGVVKFSTKSGEALEVSVYDLLGKQVLPTKTVQSQLNISSLNPGMYFVKMKQGASIATKQLLVN